MDAEMIIGSVVQRHSPVITMCNDDLAKLKSDLEAAYNFFDNVTEPALVDIATMKINEIQCRIDYLTSLQKPDYKYTREWRS